LLWRSCSDECSLLRHKLWKMLWNMAWNIMWNMMWNMLWNMQLNRLGQVLLGE
jgi:hypothetical protein